MKFDRRILVPFRRDGDLLKLVKDNDEYAYMLVGGKDALSHAALEARRQSIPLSAITEGGEGVGCLNDDVVDVVRRGHGHGGRGSESNRR